MLPKTTGRQPTHPVEKPTAPRPTKSQTTSSPAPEAKAVVVIDYRLGRQTTKDHFPRVRISCHCLSVTLSRHLPPATPVLSAYSPPTLACDDLGRLRKTVTQATHHLLLRRSDHLTESLQPARGKRAPPVTHCFLVLDRSSGKGKETRKTSTSRRSFFTLFSADPPRPRPFRLVDRPISQRTSPSNPVFPTRLHLDPGRD